MTDRRLLSGGGSPICNPLLCHSGEIRSTPVSKKGTTEPMAYVIP